MKLYGFWRSTATWRVRIALAYKGIDYEYVPVHLRRGGGEQNAPGFEATNPMRQVPVLEFALPNKTSPVRLAQSLAILEYLEERFPNPPLLPSDPIDRAHTRRIAETINSGIQPLQNTSVQQFVVDRLGADPAMWMHHWVGRGIAALDAIVRERAGRFSVGDALSIADICLVPQLYFAQRFAIDLAPYPTLLAIEATCAALPAFVHGHAENQPDFEQE